MTANIPLPTKHVSFDVALLMMKGKSEDEAIAIVNERIRMRDQAEKIEWTPKEKWPAFEIQWDEDPGCFHLSQDGLEPDQINLDDIRLVRVKLKNLDTVLQSYNLRTPEEVWSVGDPKKAARVIVHCSQGGKLSPVWVVPVTEEGIPKVGLVGGNHRLAIARVKGIEELPIIYYKEDLEKLRPLFEELSPPAVSTDRK